MRHSPAWPYPGVSEVGWLGGDPADDVLAAVRSAVLATVRRRVGPAAPQAEVLAAALAVLADMAERVDWALLAVVGEARAAGWAWEDVGRGLGVSRQAAHARFDRWVREAGQRAAEAAQADPALPGGRDAAGPAAAGGTLDR